MPILMSLAIPLAMSEQMTAALITAAVVGTLVLWVPAIHLLFRYAKARRPRAEEQMNRSDDQRNGSHELRFVLRDKG